MYVGRQKVDPKRKQLFIGVMIILLLWIIISSVMDRSPWRTVADTWHSMIGSSQEEWLSYNQLKALNEAKDSTILDLENGIEMMKKSRNFKQAIVKVESESLNMRSKPLLGAPVVLKLPVGSVVEVLYFHDETFRIGGEFGQWCKIRYAENDGWVWGNYLEMIN